MAEEATAGLQGLNIQEHASAGAQPTAILVIGALVSPALLFCSRGAVGGAPEFAICAI